MNTTRILPLLTLFPAFATAAVSDVFSAEALIMDLIQKLMLLLIVVAIGVFFWGLVKFIKNASDTAEHENGKQFIVWGLISFLVLFSIWSIIGFIVFDSLGFSNNDVKFIDAVGNFH